MNLGEMNWMEVEQYLKTDDRIMMVLGATEQHGFNRSRSGCQDSSKTG